MKTVTSVQSGFCQFAVKVVIFIYFLLFLMADTKGAAFPGNPPRLAVTNLTLTEVSWDRASIRWNPAVDPDGDRVIHFADLFSTKHGETNVTVRSFPALYGQVNFFQLPPSTTFSVKIRATDGIHWSESSLFRNIFTTYAQPKNLIAIPTNLKVIEVEEGKALMTWDFEYSYQDSIHFLPEIRSRTGADFGPWIKLPRVRNSRTIITNIFQEEEVQVRVRASNGMELSTYSPILSFKPSELQNSAPVSPDGVYAGDVTSSTARLEWSPSRDLENDELTYEISFKPEQAQDWLFAGTRQTNWFVIQGLIPNTTYVARVRAWDGEFWSSWKNTFQPFKTLALDSGKLSAPFPIVISQITSNSASINWQHADGPEGAVLIYELQLGRNAGHGYYVYSDKGIWTGTNAVLALNPNTEYGLRMRTRYQTSTSDWSYIDEPFRTLPILNPNTFPSPTNFKATHVGKTVIQLGWSPITNQVGPGFVYEISSHLRTNVFTASTNFLFEGLIPDTQYSFYIRAIEGTKVSQWPGPNVVVHTLIEPEPVPPNNPGPPVAVDFTPTSGYVSWGGTKDYNADSITHEVQWRRRTKTGVEEWNGANSLFSKSSSAMVHGLVPGALYDLRVRATDGMFTTPWSEREGTLMTLASSRQLLYYPPTIQIDAVETEEGIVLTWRAGSETQSVLEEAGIGQLKSWVASALPVYQVRDYFRAVIDRNAPAKQYRVRIIR